LLHPKKEHINRIIVYNMFAIFTKYIQKIYNALRRTRPGYIPKNKI